MWKCPSLLPGFLCVEITDLVVPSVVESGSEPWVDLSCQFSYNESERKQLDIKWYFNENVTPFLQWIPSSGRKPQIIGDDPFGGRLELRKLNKRTRRKDGANHWSQNVRVRRPTSELSGNYTCRVSTLEIDRTRRKNMIVYGERSPTIF